MINIVLSPIGTLNLRINSKSPWADRCATLINNGVFAQPRPTAAVPWIATD
jgi:hypothetical protein